METLKRFEWDFRADHSEWFENGTTRKLSVRLERSLERFFDDISNRPGIDPALLGPAKVRALLNCLHGAVVDQLHAEGAIR